MTPEPLLEGYSGPLNYAEWHQLELGLALGLSDSRTDHLLAALLWVATGRDRGVPQRLVDEVQSQPHYLATGYLLGRFLRWRYS